jgi:hypothetical protein
MDPHFQLQLAALVVLAAAAVVVRIQQLAAQVASAQC